MTDHHRWQVTVAIPRAEIAAAELVRAAASAGAEDEGMTAALQAFADARGIVSAAAKKRDVIAGEGVAARIERRDVLVGQEALLTRHHVEISRDILREVRLRRARGEVALLVAVDCRMLGAVFLKGEE